MKLISDRTNRLIVFLESSQGTETRLISLNLDRISIHGGRCEACRDSKCNRKKVMARVEQESYQSDREEVTLGHRMS